MTEQDNLLPCPFCGGEAEAFHHELEGWEPTWHIECTADNCGNGTCHHVSEAEAIAAWNTRAEPAQPDSVVEAALDMLHAAYFQGAKDVHDEWVGLDLDGGLSDDPDFGEAAGDYARSINLAALSPPRDDVREALEEIEMCRDLIQEAKGHEGPNGGFVTNHLDDAENWLDKIRSRIDATLSDTPKAEGALAAEVESAVEELAHKATGMDMATWSRISNVLLEAATRLRSDSVVERDAVLEEAARVAEGFSLMMHKPKHADAPKLIANAIRALKKSS